jgi:hypothetical protein
VAEIAVSKASPVDRWLLGIAAIWAAGLVIAAFVAPMYSTTASSGHGFVNSSATLVHENGFRVLIPVAVPLVVVGIVWAALRHRRHVGMLGAGPVAWVVVTILGIGNFLAMLSIGIFIVPVTGLLIAVSVHGPRTDDGKPRMNYPTTCVGVSPRGVRLND